MFSKVELNRIDVIAYSRVNQCSFFYRATVIRTISLSNKNRVKPDQPNLRVVYKSPI